MVRNHAASKVTTVFVAMQDPFHHVAMALPMRTFLNQFTGTVAWHVLTHAIDAISASQANYVLPSLLSVMTAGLSKRRKVQLQDNAY